MLRKPFSGRSAALRQTAVLLGALLTLASCGSDRGATVDVTVIGEPPTLFEGGVRLPPAAQVLHGATAIGLVALDQQGQVVPGLADRWIVTDDGMSYIFRLADGIKLGNAELGAATARMALLQSITGLRGTALGKDLSGIEEIRVMTGRVIEIRLLRPQPDLLLLLAQPELGLINRGNGAGPMTMRRDGKVAYLSLDDPARRGLPATEGWQDRIRPMRVRALPASAAIARYTRGESDLVLGGRFEHFPLANNSGMSRAAIRLDPVIGLFGLAAAHRDGFLADPLNREAIAMAIDRDALPAALGIGGWAMTTRLIPAGLDDSPAFTADGWAGLSLAERRAAASARVARWRGGKRDAVTLRIALPAGPGADLLFARLSQDLAAIGLTATRVSPSAPADLRLVDSVARYPGANWFFNQLSCGVLPGPCSEEADALVAQANRTATPAERPGLLLEAEKKLTESYVYIPLGAPIRWSLVGGNAAGYLPNRFASHPLMPIALRPK